MAKDLTIDVEMNFKVSDETAEKALVFLELYLADHPDKTIVVEQEGDLRVCRIKEDSNAEKQSI